MNQWKSAHAVKTNTRTLADALDGADVFFGLSVKGAVTRRDGRAHGAATRSSSPWPIPIRKSRPRKSPPCATTPSSPPAVPTTPTRSTTCWASPSSSAARSTCAPRTINDEMKIAAAEALAELAREDVPDEVAAAYAGRRLRSGPTTSSPAPFDPRLISTVPPPSPRPPWIPASRASRSSTWARYTAAARPDASIRPANALQSIFAEGRAPTRARGLRRRRGRTLDPRRHRLPQRRLRHARSWSAAKSAVQPPEPRSASATRRHQNHQRRRRRHASATTPTSSTPAAAPGLPAARLRAHGQPGPQYLRRLHGRPRPRRHHGHRPTRNYRTSPRRRRAASSTRAGRSRSSALP